MATTPGPGRCVYCGREAGELTEDHVFPESWYTVDTPADREKPKAPACRPCNNERYSKIEARLRERFALSYAGGDERVAGVQNSALRAINPGAGRGEKDRAHRSGRRSRLLREIGAMSANPEAWQGIGQVPGFGPEEPDADPTVAIPIPEADLHALGEKIIRGMTYVQTGRIIEPPYSIETALLSEENGRVVMNLMRGPETFSLGSAFEFVSARVPTDPLVGAFRMTIWGRLRIYATVEGEEEHEASEE